MQSFHVTTSQLHLKWSRDVEPALRVPSGAEVSFDLKDGGNNQIRPDNAATADGAKAALEAFDVALADPAFGPVLIEGADLGDVLKVEILELTPADYGWTGIFPGFGLLADEFPDPQLRMWDLTDTGTIKATTTTTTADGDGTNPKTIRRAVFKPGVSVPIRPFLGVVGIAPAGPGELPTIPPHPRSGGNMDCRHLVAGATLYMPVQAPGALLSCGDGHAAQGDGEVCGTAIETPMRARLRLTVEKKRKKQQEEEAKKGAGAAAANGAGDGRYAALGIGPDPREAARMALRGLIDWMEAEQGLSRVEGYMLASVAASLRMSEVVDMPNYCISCSIPLRTFSA